MLFCINVSSNIPQHELRNVESCTNLDMSALSFDGVFLVMQELEEKEGLSLLSSEDTHSRPRRMDLFFCHLNPCLSGMLVVISETDWLSDMEYTGNLDIK